MDTQTEIQAKCLFCFSTEFNVPSEDYQPLAGDQLQCAKCHRLNDYDSMMRVVKRKGNEWAEKEATDIAKKHIDKMVKDWNKSFKS